LAQTLQAGQAHPQGGQVVVATMVMVHLAVVLLTMVGCGVYVCVDTVSPAGQEMGTPGQAQAGHAGVVVVVQTVGQATGMSVVTVARARLQPVADRDAFKVEIGFVVHHLCCSPAGLATVL
jgi:hypothetical protein